MLTLDRRRKKILRASAVALSCCRSNKWNSTSPDTYNDNLSYYTRSDSLTLTGIFIALFRFDDLIIQIPSSTASYFYSWIFLTSLCFFSYFCLTPLAFQRPCSAFFFFFCRWNFFSGVLAQFFFSIVATSLSGASCISFLYPSKNPRNNTITFSYFQFFPPFFFLFFVRIFTHRFTVYSITIAEEDF